LFRPINPYGVSKLLFERILDIHAATSGLRYMALRYFSAAGADPEGEIGEARDVETHLERDEFRLGHSRPR